MSPSRWTTRAPKYLMIALLAVFGGVAACDDDGNDGLVDVDNLEESDIQGTYDAETLVANDGGVDMDVLSAGGSLTVTLAADGTVSGSLFVPASANNGTEIDETLSGTWSFDDLEDEVDVDLPASQYLPGETELEANEDAADVVTLAAEDVAVSDLLITVSLVQQS